MLMQRRAENYNKEELVFSSLNGAPIDDHNFRNRSFRVQTIQEGIFVIRSDSLLMVKRIQRQLGNRLRISSDNPAYESFMIDLNKENLDFDIVGKVIWIIKKMGN